MDDTPAGMDDQAWGSIFAILYSRDYNCNLSIEPHSKTRLGDLGLFGIDYTKKFIKKFIR